MKAVYSIFGAVVLAFGISGGFSVDSYTESQQAAIGEQGEALKVAKAAQAMCGANAAYTLEGNSVQCFTHRGHKTITAELTK